MVNIYFISLKHQCINNISLNILYKGYFEENKKIYNNYGLLSS